MTTSDAPRPEPPGVPTTHPQLALLSPARLRDVARWPLLLVLLTIALLAASIAVAVTSGHLALAPPSACNASCYR